MRLASVFRQRLRPVQIGRHTIEPHSPLVLSQNERKRSSPTEAHHISRRHISGYPFNVDSSPIHLAKVPRSDSAKTPQEAMRAFATSPKRHSSGLHAGRYGHRSGRHAKAKVPGGSPFHSASIHALPRENDPIHDAEYIVRVFQKVPLKKVWEENPKSPLWNFLHQVGTHPPTYHHVEVSLHGKPGWRQV